MKHEIGGEALAVAFHLFVQPLDGDALELGEFLVEDHPLLAQDQNSRFHIDDQGDAVFRRLDEHDLLVIEITSCALKT